MRLVRVLSEMSCAGKGVVDFKLDNENDVTLPPLEFGLMCFKPPAPKPCLSHIIPPILFLHQCEPPSFDPLTIFLEPLLLEVHKVTTFPSLPREWHTMLKDKYHFGLPLTSLNFFHTNFWLLHTNLDFTLTIWISCIQISGLRLTNELLSSANINNKLTRSRWCLGV